ncbi:hypothetical protein Tco_0435710 [Tanacetum coccineum]
MDDSGAQLMFGFGYYNNGMFMLNLNKVTDDSRSVYMSSSTVVNSSLWHARLGHVHYKRILELSKDDLIPAIDENPEKCTTCMLTKITRQPFKSITRKYVILELIHSDLCDFHATPSLGNKKYVITFIDDASKFCYVYLLHAKDEALDKFRIYKTEVELQQIDLIKTLRTDRGGESVGIIHETTAPYTPRQNGVAERKNRALKEMVNSMLSYLGLSEGFWGEAMLTACYLLNRTKGYYTKFGRISKDDHSDDVPSETLEPHKVLDEGYGEEDVILDIKIKREKKRIVITQSHYIEKILKKFNRRMIVLVYVWSTPMDPIEKLKPSIGRPVDQLEYSRAIGYFMYAVTSTRPDIAYAVGSTSLLEKPYSVASWMNQVKGSSSTSGMGISDWGCAISWHSKKQTCFTGFYYEILKVVSENQFAFVPGRRISDNILLTRDLMHNYHHDKGPPRCAFKVDIQKAYDMVDWHFLGFILKRFGFHRSLIKWIMACVTSPSFSININGNVHGSDFDFEKEGLDCRTHSGITSNGDLDSAKVIMESLDEFKQVSGLIPSIPKSTTYFCNVSNHVKISILNIMPFAEGKLPASIVQICDFVHAGVLGVGVSHSPQQLVRGFLWCNGEYKRGKAKVAWDDICLPKREGGLGLRSLEVFNLALMTTHIWNVVSNKEYLWVRWIHMYKLRGRTFWDISPKNDMSWGWRKLLQLREIVKPFFWVRIGNGLKTSLWYDRWCLQGSLIRFFTPREIAREGYRLHSCVADLISNGMWNSPPAWLVKAPTLQSIIVPDLYDQEDSMCWRDTNGLMSSFSVKCAWEALRPRGYEVSWSSIVWFSHCIPRHAFQLWLIMRRSLRTQDKLKPWDVGDSIDLSSLRCSLCGLQPDSHEHLFFECVYSSKVWCFVRPLAGMECFACFGRHYVVVSTHGSKAYVQEYCW